nr:hypothetical protein [Tanacetum cinerariifolium]
MASTNAFQQAYNSYQNSKHSQATLQSFLDELMECTEDDISKEIEENMDEENMSPRSSIVVLQEANNYYQSFHAQPTEWTQDDLDNLLMENLEEEWTQDDFFKEIMEKVDEDNSSPRSLSKEHR